MKKAAVFVLASLFLICARASAAEPLRSTLKDQKAVAVTVYNQNLGLVKDTRQIQIPEGTGELEFMDVAAEINPVTVSVRNLDEKGSFQILEQNYEYDLISEEKLLEKYVGRNLKIMRWNEFQDRKDTVDAELVANNGSPVYKINNEIYLDYSGTKILPEIPGNLKEKPTLSWLYENNGNTDRQLEVSYLTGGIGWHADYVFVLGGDDKGGDLSGWVTVENRSGTSYENAKLKLVAGDVNQVQPPAPKMMEMRASMRAPAAAQFQEQGFFEYHLYDLERPTTLKNNQTKQIGFIDAAGVQAEKNYVLESAPYFYFNARQGESPKEPVSVRLKFRNAAANRLGMPLPSGIVRIYKKDKAGSLQFAGEDSVRHTPKDEDVELKLGSAFDITAERKQTDYQQKTNNLYETEWEIKIRNHKEEDIVVEVDEQLGNQWKILSNSHSYEKKNAFTIEFKVPVKAGGEETVRYRVQVGI